MESDILQNLSENALLVLKKRYLQKDVEGNIIETPEQMFDRIAKHISNGDGGLEKEFQWILKNLYFTPNCVGPDSLIATGKGLKRVVDLEELGNLSLYSHVGYGELRKFWKNGKKEVWEIVSTSGYQIYATPEHSFLVVDKNGDLLWKMLKDIDLEYDYLSLKMGFLCNRSEKYVLNKGNKELFPLDGYGSNRKYIELPDYIDVYFAELLGYYFGDGHIDKNSNLKLAYFYDDVDLGEYLNNLIFRIFGITPKFTKIKDKNCGVISFARVAFREFMEINNLIKPSDNLKIPPAILEGDFDSICGFLRGLFEADGCVNKERINKDKSVEGNIEFYSSSEEFIRQVQLLLLGVGIYSKVSEKRKCGKVNGYRLRIYSSFLERFEKIIGFISERKKAFLSSLSKVGKSNQRIPNQKYKILEWYRQSKNRGMATYRLFSPFCGRKENKDLIAISTEKCLELANKISDFRDSYTYKLCDLQDNLYEKIYIGKKFISPVFDLTVDKTHNYIANGFVTHNSPCLMNAGLPLNNLSACFVLGIEDSLESILKTLCDTAKIFKVGGGVGIDFSPLRPKGSRIKSTMGFSSGPVSFMNMFDVFSEQIKQGGLRRAAMIAILNYRHPDILEFIDCKRNENSLSNLNISVAVDEWFFQALKTNNLLFSHDSYDFFDGWGGGGFAEVPVKKIWDKICENAWLNGEPGLIYLDNINKNNPLLKEYGLITATNPCSELPLYPNESCLDEDSLILCEDGWKAIKNVKKGDMVAVELEGMPFYETVYKSLKRGKKVVYEIETFEGYKIKTTSDHLFLDKDGNWLPVTEFNKEQLLRIPLNSYVIPEKENNLVAEMLGWIHGDGWFTEKIVGISFNEKDGDFEVKDRLLPVFLDYFECYDIVPMYNTPNNYQLQTGKKDARDKLLKLGVKLGKAYERRLPTCIWMENPVFQISFLKGLFTADGTISGKQNNQVFLFSTSKKFLIDIQILLIRFGIHSTIYESKFDESLNRRNQYKLAVTQGNAFRFMRLIGFLNSYKLNKFNWNPKYRYDKIQDLVRIKSVNKIGLREVYDLIIPKSKHFIANGFIVHNCNLGSIDVSKLVDIPVWAEGMTSINWDLFDKLIKFGIQFLNNVIDVSSFPTPEIEKMTKETRKIGLGLMGWGDLLIKLGLKYGSRESIDFAEKFMEFFKRRCNNYRRSDNAVVSCMAPTGSCSIIAGCSSGIEPNFEWEFSKNIIDNKLKVLHPLVKNYREKTGKYELPSYFVKSSEIKPEDHVKMVGVFQKYIDSGISKTINLSKDATVEDVSRAFMDSHDQGVKGITVYRQDSRRIQAWESVLPDDFKTRFDIMYGQTVKVKSPHGNAYVTKNYSLCEKDRRIICDILKGRGRLRETFLNFGKGGSDVTAWSEAVGRLITLALKNGTDVRDVVDQLDSIGGKATSFSNGKIYSSGPDAIADVILEDISQLEKEEPIEQDALSGVFCKCGNMMYIDSDGCSYCNFCGSKECF